MYRSWWPILLSISLIGLCWWLAMRNHQPGKNGPDVPLGIYPMTETPVPSVSEDRLKISVALEQTVHPYAIGAGDRRYGLEVVPWDEICVVADDHHPLTRTMSKAIAEYLTGYLAINQNDRFISQEQAARMVIMLPAGDEMKLPFPIRRVLRVATEAPTAVDLENLELGDALAMTVRVSLHDALTPTLRSASGVAPAAGVAEQAWRAQVEVAASSDPDIAWARWHATVGRTTARAVLEKILPAGNRVEMAWWEPAGLKESISSRHHHGLENVPEWQGTIGLPPRTGVERWHGVVQTPLLRGWSGMIVGNTVPDVKKGKVLSTIDAFSDVVGEDKWTGPEIDAQSGRHLWRANDNNPKFDRIVADPAEWGWVIACYQVHPQVSTVVDGWIAGAKDNGVVAAHLRQHVHAEMLTDEQRSRAQEVLRALGDAASLAALGNHQAGSQAQQQVAQAVAWIRGIDGAQRSPAQLEPLSLDDWDRQPAIGLIQDDAAAAVVPWGDAGWAMWSRLPPDGVTTFGLTTGQASITTTDQ